jgi:hypothetical protein
MNECALEPKIKLWEPARAGKEPLPSMNPVLSLQGTRNAASKSGDKD